MRNTVHCSETQNSAVIFVWNYFFGKFEQKQTILSLKCKSLIALLNLYKIIIKCVIMVISAEKLYSLCDID